MDADEGLGLIRTGFGLSSRETRKVLQIGWVVGMTLHAAWAFGAFAFLGLSGYARAIDVEKLQKTVSASARVTLSQEIRAQVRVRCVTNDERVKEALTRYIDSLQSEYESIAGVRAPEPACDPPERG